MKRILAFLPAVFLILTFPAAAQSKKPKTVRDFFMALPAKYFSLDCCYDIKDARQAKEKYLATYLNVEDTINGYMSGYGDAAQEGFVMTLFKRSNGTYLIGFYTYGEGGVEDTPWTVFLDYDRGKWTDVSRQLIPDYSKEKFVYELPRYGTTVVVFEKDENGEDWNRGKKRHDLVWTKGKFIIRK
jgi:hypothetical protein